MSMWLLGGECGHGCGGGGGGVEWVEMKIVHDHYLDNCDRIEYVISNQ